MAGVDLREARLDEAQLEGAQLGHALMSGRQLRQRRLDGADLSGAWLQGANFILASLQGADLTGAKLQMADFTSAGLQGANLSLANLEGASLRDAELDGASLQMARLTARTCRARSCKAATCVAPWSGAPCRPAARAPAVADMAQIVLQPPVEDDLVGLGASLAQLENGPLKARLADGVARLVRRRAEQRLGCVDRPAGVAGARQGQRNRQCRRLQGAPHRVSGAAHVPAALRRWRRGRRRCPPRHGTGVPGRHARSLRQAKGHRLRRHRRHEPPRSCASSPPPPTPRAGSRGGCGPRFQSASWSMLHLRGLAQSRHVHYLGT